MSPQLEGSSSEREHVRSAEQDAVLHALVHAAAAVRDAKHAREGLIQDALDLGLSERRIAGVAGLSCVSIHNRKKATHAR